MSHKGGMRQEKETNLGQFRCNLYAFQSDGILAIKMKSNELHIVAPSRNTENPEVFPYSATALTKALASIPVFLTYFSLHFSFICHHLSLFISKMDAMLTDLLVK